MAFFRRSENENLTKHQKDSRKSISEGDGERALSDISVSTPENLESFAKSYVKILKKVRCIKDGFNLLIVEEDQKKIIAWLDSWIKKAREEFLDRMGWYINDASIKRFHWVGLESKLYNPEMIKTIFVCYIKSAIFQMVDGWVASKKYPDLYASGVATAALNFVSRQARIQSQPYQENIDRYMTGSYGKDYLKRLRMEYNTSSFDKIPKEIIQKEKKIISDFLSGINSSEAVCTTFLSRAQAHCSADPDLLKGVLWPLINKYLAILTHQQLVSSEPRFPPRRENSTSESKAGESSAAPSSESTMRKGSK